MENTVEMMLNESAPDDAAQAHDEAESLDTLIEDTAPAAPEQEAPPAKEPGWIKQRVGKAVEKAVAEAEARVAAKYEAMLAPLRESMLDRQAQELVQSGEFKSLERAKEYVRLKNGDLTTPQQPAEQQPPQERPRDSQGRFQRSSESENRARADLLAQQAHKIQERRGLDVMGAFNSDPGIKNRVLSGEWDFYDVAEHLEEGGQQRRSVPAPVRSPNGMGSASMSIANMTDAQFERLEQNLRMGKRYDVSK
jgi:hypothetical protein